jgi:hypothetical protein
MTQWNKVPAWQRLWGSVTEAPVDLCWEWKPKSRLKSGYGRITVNKRQMLAHRAAWEFAFGEIPTGMLVRHKCDNPSCCNPFHLELGTDQDNYNDMVERGRRIFASAKGERNCKAKLTEKEVLKIRELYAAGGESTNTLARKFNVTQPLISQIVLRKIWQHI